MSGITDLLLFPAIIGIIIFLLIFVAFLFQDVLPAWRKAMKIGPYELWLHQGASRNIKRRRRNLVDLTEMTFDKKEGAFLIENLIKGMKDPGFHMPPEERHEAIKRLQGISEQYPLVETGNYRLAVLGIGSMLGGAQVGVTFLDKRISFPEGYVEGQSEGWRGRKYMRGRQFFFPKKQKKFLGKRKVRISYIELIPPSYDQKLEAEKLETMREFATDVVPLIPLLAQNHYHEDRHRTDEAKIKQLSRELSAAHQAGFSGLAGGVASKMGLSQLSIILGLGTKPVRSAIPAVVLIVGPIMGDIIFQYGFNTNPLFGVLLGSMLALFLTISR